ncbi:hypothetical protein FRC01_010851, partial [Tulasnella sp. 417]
NLKMDTDDFPDEINLVFNGIDGVEAESFIVSVIRFARAEGKTRDNEWLVDLVSSCMRGEALRWYVELDEDTQNDWKLFRKEIFRRYPTRNQPSAPYSISTIPIPAAAATPPNTISTIQPAQALNASYRIQLHFANTNDKFFLSTEKEGTVHLTSNSAKALNVRWTRGNELRLIEKVRDWLTP